MVKKPKSAVAGDISKTLLQRYPYHYAIPAAVLFNNIIQTGVWPRQWVKEQTVVLSKLGKGKVPQNKDDLRTISKISWLSKCLENILGDSILPAINSSIDPGQCGGLKKTSISHYLVKLLDFVHTTLDKNTPHCAVLCTEDQSKAYNRGSHNLVVEPLLEDLHAMKLPGYLLVLICSYLSSRSMVLSHHGAKSSERSLPGGFGAGTWLSGLL